MASPQTRGLFRKTPTGVWLVRRPVPPDLRKKFGWEFKRSTGSIDSRIAERRRDDFWREWDTLIADARRRGEGSGISIYHVQVAIGRWRKRRCLAAQAGPMTRCLSYFDDLGELGPGFPLESETTQPLLERLLNSLVLASATDRKLPPSPELQAAHGYFRSRPEASRSLGTPPEVARRLAGLRAAAEHEQGWTEIADFDAALDAAVAAGGLAAPIPPAIRPLIRQEFAEAWLEVVQHEEHDRRRSALQLAAENWALASPSTTILLAAEPAPVQPAEGRTLGEVLTAFRQHRAVRGEGEAEWQRYSHAYRVLIELHGEDRPIRSITSEDARKAVALLRRVPANATKKFPGLSLSDAAEAAAVTGAKTLAPHTLNNLVHRMGALFKFAVHDGLADRNPYAGLAVEGHDEVDRRAFTEGELMVLFAGLAGERAANSARWWVPAIALYQGARLNEVAQLYTGDIKEDGGIPYIHVTEFDESGRRVDDKSLKNTGSQRAVPIHPALLRAGFRKFVEVRRAGGEVRLFPELKLRKDGGYGRDLSRWFGRYLDRIGLTSSSLVYHSFRHGWTDAARAAAIPDRNIEALGGWEVKSQAGKYGDIQNLSVNLQHLGRIKYGTFSIVKDSN